MSLTYSTMMSLGSLAPDFSLPDTEGKMVSLENFKDAKALLVVFICNHCPYVKHISHGLAKLAREYMKKGVAVVAINSNDAKTYREDSPARMKEEAANAGYGFPYLYDETQEVAKAYRAACTPDFYLFDKNRKLVYRGQMDDSRPENNIAVSGKDITGAMIALLGQSEIPKEQKPSVGCNIKWRPGNEPDY